MPKSPVASRNGRRLQPTACAAYILRRNEEQTLPLCLCVTRTERPRLDVQVRDSTPSPSREPSQATSGFRSGRHPNSPLGIPGALIRRPRATTSLATRVPPPPPGRCLESLWETRDCDAKRRRIGTSYSHLPVFGPLDNAALYDANIPCKVRLQSTDYRLQVVVVSDSRLEAKRIAFVEVFTDTNTTNTCRRPRFIELLPVSQLTLEPCPSLNIPSFSHPQNPKNNEIAFPMGSPWAPHLHEAIQSLDRVTVSP